MRVLIITRDFGLGSGLTNVVLDYLRNFPADCMTVEHASFRPPEPSFEQQLVSRRIEMHRLDENKLSASLSILRRLIKSRSYNLVVGTSWKPYIAAAIAAQGTNARVVAWIHGIPLAVDGLFRKHLYRILFRRKPIIFASKAVQNAHSYRSHFGKEAIVYAGISPLPPLHPKTMRAAIGVPEDAFVAGYTAQFIAWKNHKTLLRAASELVDKHPSLHIVLIGEGPIYTEVFNLSAKLSLNKRVHFLGKRDDAKEMLGVFDAYVHPSDGEAFGLAVAEAMLAGLPVIASNTGAFPEFIDDEITGLLVSPHDIGQLSNALSRLIESPYLRARLGRHAKHKIVTSFTIEKFIMSLTSAFQNAM